MQGMLRVCVYRLSRAVMQVTVAAGKVRDGTLPYLVGWTYNHTVYNSLTQFHIVAYAPVVHWPITNGNVIMRGWKWLFSCDCIFPTST